MEKQGAIYKFDVLFQIYCNIEHPILNKDIGDIAADKLTSIALKKNMWIFRVSLRSIWFSSGFYFYTNNGPILISVICIN